VVAPEVLSATAPAARPPAEDAEGPAPARQLPRALFVGVAVGAAALLIALSRHVFLFWDDFLFLGEARESDLSWSYLTDPLFQHFSPVVRLFNIAVVDAIPEHPWVVPLVLFALLAGVTTSVTWLMVVLHGRTRLALLGSLLLAPSLTLLELGNWWTAGVNILPALIGFYVAFGAMVQLLRGGTRLWALACFGGAAVGVLDYELPMLLCGYLGLWFLLFGSRVTSEPRLATLRRTWWVWLGVIAIDVAAAVNYRLNYYDQVPRPSAIDVVHALGRSLVRTLLPTVVGFHDPRSDVFSALSLAIGCVCLVLLVGWLLLTRAGAWRGLLFAGAGWMLPTLLLVLNRVALFGVDVVDNAIYFHLPTVLFVVGVLEAVRAPRRGSRIDVSRFQRVAVPTAVVAVVAGYAWSAGPTARYQLPLGASPFFVERARDSAADLRAEVGPFSVLNSDVSGSVVPDQFAPYNRADQVLAITVPGLAFDDLSKPLYRLSDTGDLVPVAIDWLAESAPSDLALRNGTGDATRTEEGLCFTSTDSVSVLWPLGESLSGPDLVIRTVAKVDATTKIRLSVRAGGESRFEGANRDQRTVSEDRSTILDTVAASSVATVRVKDFEPDVHVCVQSIAVGRVVPRS
jgi:hypothetical protein